VLVFARSRHRRFDDAFSDFRCAVRVDGRTGAVRPRRRHIINARLAPSQTAQATFNVIGNRFSRIRRGIVNLRYFSQVKVDERE
jgi:hypothetical protein